MVIEVVMNFKGGDANAPVYLGLLINLAELLEIGIVWGWPRLCPQTTEILIGFGGINIILIVVLLQEAGVVLTGLPAPGSAKEALDDASAKCFAVHDFWNWNF